MTRSAALAAYILCILAWALAVGCAAPGEPSPRHPVVPAAITDLTARQSGSAIALKFRLPRQSTDRESLAEAPTIEIYRATLSPGPVPDRKTSWRLVYVIPSERAGSYMNGDFFEFRDPLSTDDLARITGSSLAYKVRTRAVKSRASGDSNIYTSRIYAPPGTPLDLHTTVTESAIVLSWSEPLAAGAAPKTAGYHVYRAEIEPGDGTAPIDVSQVKLKTPLTILGSPTSPGFSDIHFEFGSTYSYTVRTVTQNGADTTESADSAPAIVTPKDIFPPAAPVGLEATIDPAIHEAPTIVELSWAISPEGDLAGYYVYRSDGQDTPGLRISRGVLLSPTFRDTSVVPGRQYWYRVSAVDRAGNESPRSPAAQIDVP